MQPREHGGVLLENQGELVQALNTLNISTHDMGLNLSSPTDITFFRASYKKRLHSSRQMNKASSNSTLTKPAHCEMHAELQPQTITTHLEF